MLSSIIILIVWIVQVFICFYYVRFVSNTTIRCILTIVPCVILTYAISHDLPPLHMPSMLLVTYCWLTTIRLIHLTIVSPNQCSESSSFILKILWMVFPIVPCTSNHQQQWPIHYDFISASVKLLVNHWMYRLIMFYIFVLAYTFISDVQSAIVRIVTRDKYMLKSLTNFPFLSQSLREFWGRRYNQLIGTILRESIFQPIVQHISSKTVASLIAFLISGLLHVHLALVTFKVFRPAISNIIFFLLHGIACSIYKNRTGVLCYQCTAIIRSKMDTKITRTELLSKLTNKLTNFHFFVELIVYHLAPSVFISCLDIISVFFFS
jgi:hypothetical protein